MIEIKYEIFKVILVLHEDTLNIFRVNDSMMEDKTYKKLKLPDKFTEKEIKFLKSYAPIIEMGRSTFDMLDNDENKDFVVELLYNEIKTKIL